MTASTRVCLGSIYGDSLQNCRHFEQIVITESMSYAQRALTDRRFGLSFAHSLTLDDFFVTK